MNTSKAKILTLATASKSKTRRLARAKGFRSGLEDKVSNQLSTLGVPVVYEKHRMSYIRPAKRHRYTPDFILPNGIIIETKGYFKTEDRQKHLLIKDQNPLLDVRFVFSRSSTRLNKQSKTTYAKWCDDKGFIYADALIPLRWLQEPATKERIQAAMAALAWKPSALILEKLEIKDD